MHGIWKLDVPIKVQIFLWKIANNALPLNTKRSQIIPNTSPLCVMCQEESESVNHLFLSCTFARAFWFASQEGIRTEQFPQISVDQWIKCLILESIRGTGKDQSRAIYHAGILWMIWKHRCDVVFRGEISNPWTVLQKVGELVRQ